ncbi:MAG: aldose 1-epimerase family protein [Coriobacteriia bacterium]|nr:aldose 1-epimerase family protein [Coriobacteriia bacterium]
MHEFAEYTIANDRLQVRISSCGAEPQSIVCDGLERLWCADPAVWDKHAPLLFPLIGRLRDGRYLLEGQPVDAPRHGFCRQRAFTAQQVSPSCVRFTTQDDASTKQVFPFSFQLTVEYSLQGNSIQKRHIVSNTGATGSAAMPFELGGHEAYAICLGPSDTSADWYLQFAPDARLQAFGMDDQGILTLPKQDLPLDGGRLQQFPQQLGLDTVVVENVPGSTVTLACNANPHTLTVDFPDFPYLGIWTAYPVDNPRYLCVEPWSALPDGHFMSRELAEKPGVISVQPGQHVELTYRMTFGA